jgi:hypothetical protein
MCQQPTLAQLVERRTVVGKTPVKVILRSLVRIRQVGFFVSLLSVFLCLKFIVYLFWR